MSPVAEPRPAPAQYACARAWAALAAVHARVAGRLAAGLGAGCGLSVTEFEILLRLEHAAGRGLRLSQLTPAIPLTQPALSRAVTRLADRGLLTRSGAPEDGRGVLIFLTAAGEHAARDAAHVHSRIIRELVLDRLSDDDQAVLADLLARLLD